MQQFKISEDAYKRFRKKGLMILIPLAVVGVIVLVVTSIMQERNSEFQTWPYALPILFLLYGWFFFRSLKRQKTLLLSYRITLTEHDITREQMNTPTLTINFMEIKEIIKTKKGNFMIQGLHRTDAIHIPYWIENADQLEAALQRFAPITDRASVPLYVWNRSLVSVFGLAMLLVVEFAENKIIVGTCAVLGITALIWAFYETYISKNLPANVRRKSWSMLLLILVIAYLAYQKLTGHILFF